MPLVALEDAGVLQEVNVIRSAPGTQHLPIRPAESHHEGMAVLVVRKVLNRLLESGYLVRKTTLPEKALSVNYIISLSRRPLRLGERCIISRNVPQGRSLRARLRSPKPCCS